MIIIFCGTDCSGKDSVMHELAKLYDHQYYMSPRSPICNIVYDTIYNRITPERMKSYLKLIKVFLKSGAYFVYVKVKPEILEQRAKARNEKHVSSFDDFKYHIRVYEEIIKMCKSKSPNFEHRFLEINNSGDLMRATKNLKNKIDKLQQGSI
jgi:thymidylate kinase